MKGNSFQQAAETLRSGVAASLGPDRRSETLSEPEIHSAVREGVSSGAVPAARAQTVLALLLLWHDHLETAHNIVQHDQSADASFIHALMHRREPDYWNSKYWWRRAGSHPAYADIAPQVRALLRARGRQDRLSTLLPGGLWQPDAFVDACEAVAAHPGNESDLELLREVQRIEFSVLLDRLRGS